MTLFSFLTLGYLTALTFLLRFAGFISSYLIPSKLPRYLHPGSWAIVTGSTSGLGLALATALCSRGFNVLLHGRDPEKLQRVFPDRECEILLLDAASCFSPESYESSQTKIHDAVTGKNVSLLINNVGIGHSIPLGNFRPLESHTPASINVLLNANITFMTHLTYLLLPTFSSATPSLILNIGSVAELAMPYLTVYSATKSYMSTFSKALDAEMRAEGKGVRVECMVLGDVDTPVHPMERSLSVLSAEEAAGWVLERAGGIGMWGGENIGAPYWFHGVLWWACRAQPWWALRAGITANLREKVRKDK
ncbi:Uncharacterized protein BP5553_08698 [Venustampulla echinocandica]|uniref:NAD(P)-binding protein n=1 Tax=Venustampulla echinocandica TaxID=2656787 RepID=A0A370TF01_9HELO|nr:Uncharacterized protein BP5553_08698 [Venustampulla echinocandica]RDL33259.1 Uncharacterized protein BP5553_08698 [Venustampulla echinocandica]